ncbi:MAG: BamA/TamA family outer membrane protein [Candidatus Eisenbacteria bacterium]
MALHRAARRARASTVPRRLRVRAAQLLILLMTSLLTLFSLPTIARGQEARRLERVEIEGKHRTDDWRILRRLALTPGEPIDATRLLQAKRALEQTGFFREVTVHTRPGSAPEQVIAVFGVEERSPHLRFGAGYEDLSGWYLLPVQVVADNLTGREESLRLSARLGYRLAGAALELGHETRGGGRWDLALSSATSDRVYYVDQLEVAQSVHEDLRRLRVEAPLGQSLTLEGSLTEGRAWADSSARVYAADDTERRKHNQSIPFEDLPREVQSDLGRRDLVRLGLALGLDARGGPGLTQRGTRGRLRIHWTVDGDAVYPGGDLDLRGYRPIGPGAALASRLHLVLASSRAPFYERPYLGGLYSVRGFPSQSLSPPGGDLGTLTGSIELRVPWVGAADRPRLSALVFADGGVGWRHAAPDDLSLGAGVGFRWRVPLLDHLGLDLGYPLTDTPAHEAFHVNGSLGWSF